MSFILDALKKSEVERQRQAIPGLMDSRPLPPRAKFPLWAAALIALLAVNLVILAVVLTRRAAPATASLTAPAITPATTPAASPATAPAATPATAPATAAPDSPVAAAMAPAAPTAATTAGAPSAAAPARAAPDHFSPMDAAPPVYAPEIPATQDYAGAARRSARAASSGETATHHAVNAAPDPVLTESDPADAEVLPSINEINLANQPALANLHLDVHVYATQPSERFVYINMRKYREGATLAEGPVLERIRRDGVVLSYQGLRFVLPRQQ
jgi:general secretion pathway protein B